MKRLRTLVVAFASILETATPSQGAAAVAPIELDALLEQARKVQDADVVGWAGLRFRRRALRERLDASGQVYWREDLELIVTPSSSGFDEELLRVDGRRPTPREVAKHRRDAVFTRHYQALRRGEGREEEEGGYSLSYLFRMSSYSYAGQEALEGVACHRLDFSPGPIGQREGLAGKFAEAMSGSLWITVDGMHLFRARVRSVKPVSVAFGLARIPDLKVTFESQRITGGAWAPHRIEVWTKASILGKPTRRRNLYLYTDYAAHP